MKIIELSFRRNLIYLLFTIIFYLLRRILSIIIGEIYGLDNSLIFCFLMFLGEIIGGLSIYYRQISFLKKNKAKNENISIAYKFNQRKKKELKKADSWPKIYLLIFFASFFDLIEFVILANFIPKISALSTTSTLRLCCILTITSSVLCYSTLGFKIGKHQKFSLISMSICLFTIIILEVIYKPKDVEISDFIISYLLVFIHFIFLSFTDITERYLADYDYLNPLLMLMTEGIFGFIMTILYSFYQDPFKEIKAVYKKVETWQFFILIFLLILYMIFSAGINVYKIFCNVLYSPMTKSLSTYFLNSIFIIYHYIDRNDFIIEGDRYFFYFFINLFFSVLIDFLGLIYNEFFILNFCGLENDTHIGITIRANKQEIEMMTNKMVYEDDDYFIQQSDNYE